MKKIPFYQHDLGQPELQSVANVLQGTILTTGDTVAAVEKKLAYYFKVPHAVGCTSWTGAAHIALVALGIGPGDEVITTPLTFIATATAILQAGATPVFVDVEPTTGNLDANRIKAAITPRTKAILPVHLYGQMCDIVRLRKIADEHHLALLEDAAHCVEGERDGIRPGQKSEAALFSFFATKNLTCGEGGAIITRHKHLDELLRLLRLHGMNKTAADRERHGYQHWDMEIMGWKYNMDNIQAALLLPQFDRLETKWQQRARLAELYQEELANVPGLSWPTRIGPGRHANHLFTVWVEPERRDSLLSSLQAQGIGTTVNYRAIHLLTFFAKKYGFQAGDFPEAERIGNATLSLPFYPQLQEEEVKTVCQMLKRLL